jgi:glycosyltransferase involved in cell wall biosynthesis
MNPRVSFIVPCYNYGRFLAQALDSLLAQTFRELEVIVIDDGSTDETQDVLKRYAAIDQVRVVRHQQNQGNIRSCNEGIGLAHGEFVGVLASDDYFLRMDAVARVVEVFDAHPDVGFVYQGQQLVDERGVELSICQPHPGDYVRGGLDEFTEQVFGISIDGSGLLIRRECHSEIGLYDPRLPHVGDWDLWFRIMMRYRVGYIADLLVAKRMHSSNMSHTMISARTAVEEKRKVVRDAFDTLPAGAPESVRRMRRAAIDRSLLNESYCNRCLGRIKRSWQSLFQAAVVSPALLVKPAFYVELARLSVQTAIGQTFYTNLAVLKRAWLRA